MATQKGFEMQQFLISIHHENHGCTSGSIPDVVRRALHEHIPAGSDPGCPGTRIDVERIRAEGPDETANALLRAERFIAGFEDDETQERIADILGDLRSAVRREQLRPALLNALTALRAAAIAFRIDAYEREPHLRIGNEAVNMLSASLLHADRIIAQTEGRAHD